MTSTARTELDRRLRDFDELVQARDLICPSNAGRPSQRQGAAILRSSVVMLSAAFEAYVEEVYDSAVDAIFGSASNADRKALKNGTSGRLNNASTLKVNMLFFNVGLPWLMQSSAIRWQKFSNESVRKELDRIIKTRNQIAHGEDTPVRKVTAIKWKGVIEKLADRLDQLIADHIQAQTGTRPW